jgi:hypothetical protein
MTAPAPAHSLEELAPWLAGTVATLINGSAFERLKMWPHAVVVLRADEQRVTSRGDFAGWLASNDLASAAKECTRRRVPHGSILLWILLDAPGAAAAEFHVFNLAGALMAARSP